MYKGYRVSISKDSNQMGWESVDIASQAKYSFNPNGILGTTQKNGATLQRISDGSDNFVKVIAINSAKQAINFGLSNYGNLTGDYLTQENLQAYMDVIGLGLSMSQGPIGIAAAAASITLKAVSHEIELAKKNQLVSILRERTGTNLYSGGR